MSILIETMRREGYELQVGQPQVIIKHIDGVKCEPIEMLTVNVPEQFSGSVIDQVTQRKGELLIMEPKGDVLHLEFGIPARGIIGLRNNLLTATQEKLSLLTVSNPMNHGKEKFPPVLTECFFRWIKANQQLIPLINCKTVVVSL